MLTRRPIDAREYVYDYCISLNWMAIARTMDANGNDAPFSCFGVAPSAAADHRLVWMTCANRTRSVMTEDGAQAQIQNLSISLNVVQTRDNR